MKQALEDYCREVEEKAEKYAQDEVMCRRYDHLRAFNLGRMAQRVEKTRQEIWLRVAWLLLGLAIGLAFGAWYSRTSFPRLAQRLSKSAVWERSAGCAGFDSARVSLRV